MRQFPVVLAVVLLFGQSNPSHGAEVDDWVAKELPSLLALYKHLHQHPELSMKEAATGEKIADELRRAGCETTGKIGGHGVAGVLANGQGPTIMLRCDLDALPVVEETGVDYASKVKIEDDRGATVGVMHACGHDIHMTNLVGVARFLASHKDLWKGTILFVGQPAEERGEGAQAMLDDGLFRRFPRPDYALALHVDAMLPAGHVGYRPGYALANVDSIDITIKGRGGHGAYPHTTIDPIVIAARLILDLQTIVSREVRPIEPSVITVGSIHGGTKHNIIGDECRLQLTVRTYAEKVRQQVLTAIERKAKAAALSSGAPEPTVVVSEGTPALFNDEALTARIAPVLKRVVGDDKVKLAEAEMGGEDFSRYHHAGVPVMMYRLGAVKADRLAKFVADGRLPPSLHSPQFDPDPEEALTTGVKTLSAAAIELLQPEKE